MSDWTEKYRPSTLDEVRGNDKARDALREWAESWEDHRKAVILHGSPGVGKTSAAHALANDMGCPTIELNASDQRKADVVKRIAGEAAKSGTLSEGSAGRRLVVLDEADNFHGNVDYGGSRAVSDVIKSANQPIVLIANEFYDMSKGLRNACETIEFRDVSARSIVPVLRDICRQEGIEFEQSALEAIAESTSGDLRSAINDLQAIAEKADRLTEEAVVTGERDRSKGIFDFLDEVIKTAGAQEALYASYDVDETPDDLINWIEDNVPKDFEGAELADAYDSLARADRWLGRVRATQEYSYWRYASDNMTAGVAAARREPKGGWTRYGPPSYWRKLGSSRSARDRRDYVARKIAETGGVSMGTARRELLPHLSVMTHHCKNRELTVEMAARYDLDAEHVAFVTGSGKDTNKVQGIVEEARERREEAAVEASGGAFERAERAAEPEAADEDDAPSESGGSDEPDATVTVDAAGTSAGTEETDEDLDADPETNEDDSQSGLSDFM
ncbi:replication factor C large subunit [Halalkalicoccus ordinarius]|uniref:replication factor C large subunit n=1 Tax=Halalkalicoccus ordinarius TaxID=3116651 RepID=UPI00300EAE7C